MKKKKARKWFLEAKQQSNPQHVIEKEKACILIVQLMEDAYYHCITRPYIINTEKLRKRRELKITPLHFVAQDVSSSALCSLIAEKSRIMSPLQALMVNIFMDLPWC